MSRLRLVIFDVDGTIVDSQAQIVAGFHAAFGAHGIPVPDDHAIRATIGLSLPVAIARLVPGLSGAEAAEIALTYKAGFAENRVTAPEPRLFDGAAEAIRHLAADPFQLLGVATGKSRRGLSATLDGHGLGAHFVTRQTADDHPSKPDPAMIEAALRETGVSPRDAVIVGDTGFDMEMGRAAGIGCIGVDWGYHAPELLTAAGAGQVISDFAALAGAVAAHWETA